MLDSEGGQVTLELSVVNLNAALGLRVIGASSDYKNRRVTLLDKVI
jgi:hypothetical protein